LATAFDAGSKRLIGVKGSGGRSEAGLARHLVHAKTANT